MCWHAFSLREIERERGGERECEGGERVGERGRGREGGGESEKEKEILLSENEYLEGDGV